YRRHNSAGPWWVLRLSFFEPFGRGISTPEHRPGRMSFLASSSEPLPGKKTTCGNQPYPLPSPALAPERCRNSYCRLGRGVTQAYRRPGSFYGGAGFEIPRPFFGSENPPEKPAPPYGGESHLLASKKVLTPLLLR